MVQFCFSRSHLGIETVSCHLLLRMQGWKWIGTWKSWSNLGCVHMNPYIFVTTDSKNNGPVLFFKITFRHWNCFLSSVVTDGKDGNGLEPEKVDPTYAKSTRIGIFLRPLFHEMVLRKHETSESGHRNRIDLFWNLFPFQSGLRPRPHESG